MSDSVARARRLRARTEPPTRTARAAPPNRPGRSHRGPRHREHPAHLTLARHQHARASQQSTHPVLRAVDHGSAWSRKLEANLRRRYPYADLEVENRALGGHAAQLLIKAAESDLYPYYPDLMILHVLGAHDAYEALIRGIRERTTAEVLHQTDHVFDPAELSEPTDPDALGPNRGSWSAFMNHAFLPSLVERYRTTLCDQREAWKRYLARHRLAPAALLSDEVHLNGRGDDLMAAWWGGAFATTDGRTSPAEQWVTRTWWDATSRGTTIP